MTWRNLASKAETYQTMYIYWHTVTVTHQTQWISYTKICWANINKKQHIRCSTKNVLFSRFMILVMLKIYSSLLSKLKKIIREMRTTQKEDLPKMWQNNSLDMEKLTDQFSLQYIQQWNSKLVTNICVWSEQYMLQLRLLLVNLFNCELLIYRLLWSNVPTSNCLWYLPIYNLGSHVEQKMLECGT